MTFTIDHALSCKKGGFISLRHNEIRNFTEKLLKETCHDVALEPNLQHLGGVITSTSSNTAEEARVDISVRSFWVAGQKAFLDVRVFNPLAKRYATLTTPKSYEINEREKKRLYNERILEVEHGSFTPLIFSATGGMSRETRKFYKRLAEMLSEKRKCSYSTAMTWLAIKLSFAFVRSMVTCIRGSRSTRRNDEIHELRTS